ncbi:hypothetical protein AB4Y30_03785 [Ornithinibacillus sp. 4-3]|uniref:Uncharacterized protein n=1 Tax=Ornithinibacillus sp. 4-3 TaxID=3231488 RepID=A0AB39HMS1_9BACI
MNKYLIAFTMILVLFLAGCSLIHEANLASPNEEAATEEAEGGHYELISVKMSDKPKFSKEEWREILKQIQNGEVILEKE